MYRDLTWHGRQKLDRRRLETAHFRYAILLVQLWYPDITPRVYFYPDMNKTLSQFTPIYHIAFHKKYSGKYSYHYDDCKVMHLNSIWWIYCVGLFHYCKGILGYQTTYKYYHLTHLTIRSTKLDYFMIAGHFCDTKGCGSVLVLDGNMKNSRDVCAAVDAGFVEYTGLPGRVKTGCMSSPEQRSRFCSQHKPCKASSGDESQPPGHRIVETILTKKVTWANTHYQVRAIIVYSRKYNYPSVSAIITSNKYFPNRSTHASNTRTHISCVNYSSLLRHGSTAHLVVS